jgi:hypothetical protein
MLYFPFLLWLSLFSGSRFDIAPYPIVLKSIFTHKPCEVQMVRERVEIDQYRNRSVVRCTFYMKNHGDSLTLPVGFPAMYFFHEGSRALWPDDYRKHVTIEVDGRVLGENDIQVPDEMRDVYDSWKKSIAIEAEYDRRIDALKEQFKPQLNYKTWEYDSVGHGNLQEFLSLFKDLKAWKKEQYTGISTDAESLFDQRMKLTDYRDTRGAFPWFVWKVHFKKGEERVIKVNYDVEPGRRYRGGNYVRYLLSTGADWHGPIEQADIVMQLKDIRMGHVRQRRPKGFTMNLRTKTIRWTFLNFEPTKEHDIEVDYFRK